MTRRGSALLILNAALVILLACVLGMPYGEARKKEAGVSTWFHVPGTASQWQLAHLEGLINGIAGLALAAALALITLSRRSETVIFWSLIGMLWGNVLGGLAAALGADDSFSADLVTNNPAAFLLYGVAAAGALVGLVEVARCAWRQAQQPAESVNREPVPLG
jgi:hypothetical protein